MGSTWGPSGDDRTQEGPMLAPWTLLSGQLLNVLLRTPYRQICPDAVKLGFNSLCAGDIESCHISLSRNVDFFSDGINRLYEPMLIHRDFVFQKHVEIILFEIRTSKYMSSNCWPFCWGFNVLNCCIALEFYRCFDSIVQIPGELLCTYHTSFHYSVRNCEVLFKNHNLIPCKPLIYTSFVSLLNKIYGIYFREPIKSKRKGFCLRNHKLVSM